MLTINLTLNCRTTSTWNIRAALDTFVESSNATSPVPLDHRLERQQGEAEADQTRPPSVAVVGTEIHQAGPGR